MPHGTESTYLLPILRKERTRFVSCLYQNSSTACSRITPKFLPPQRETQCHFLFCASPQSHYGDLNHLGAILPEDPLLTDCAHPAPRLRPEDVARKVHSFLLRDKLYTNVQMVRRPLQQLRYWLGVCSLGVSLTLSQRWPLTTAVTASTGQLPRAAGTFHQSWLCIQCGRYKGTCGSESSQAFRCQFLRPPAGIWGTGLGTKWDPSGQCFSKEAPVASDTELAASITSHRQEWIVGGWCLEPQHLQWDTCEKMVAPSSCLLSRSECFGTQDPHHMRRQDTASEFLKKQCLPPHAGILPIPFLWAGEAQPTSLLAPRKASPFLLPCHYKP